MSPRRWAALEVIGSFAIGAALVLAPGAANAQGGAQAGAQGNIASEEECARAPSPEEELACLREALAASREALRRAEPTPAPSTPFAVPQGREVATAPAAPPAVATPAVELGEEQVARTEPAIDAQPDRSGALTASVTDVRTDLRGLLVMQLDNGQIWRQDERVGGPIRLSGNEAADVEITRSGFGGYRMRFLELGRKIAVSRLR